MKRLKQVNSKTGYETALRLMSKASPPLDEVLAILNKAHGLGDMRATYALATWFLHGKETVVGIDVRKGNSLLRAAADAGLPEACFDYAVSLERGAGTRKNERLAAVYYVRAAIAGDEMALKEVGRLFYYGIGVEKNRRIAWTFLDASRCTKERVTGKVQFPKADRRKR